MNLTELVHKFEIPLLPEADSHEGSLHFATGLDPLEDSQSFVHLYLETCSNAVRNLPDKVHFLVAAQSIEGLSKGSISLFKIFG